MNAMQEERTGRNLALGKKSPVEHMVMISEYCPRGRNPGGTQSTSSQAKGPRPSAPHEVPHEKTLTVRTPREKGGGGAGGRGPNFKNIINEE